MSHILDRLAKHCADISGYKPSPHTEQPPPIRVECNLLETESEELGQGRVEIKRRNDPVVVGTTSSKLMSDDATNKGDMVVAYFVDSAGHRTPLPTNLVPLPKHGERSNRIFIPRDQQRDVRCEIERNITKQHIALAEEKYGSADSVSVSSGYSPVTVTDSSASSNPYSVQTFLESLSAIKNFPVFEENCSFCKDDSKYDKRNLNLYKQGVCPHLGRCVIATNAIQEGSIVFHELPIVALPSTTNKPDSTICVNCYKLVEVNTGSTIRICKGCSWPVCEIGKCDRAVALHSRLECDLFKSRGVRYINDASFDFDTFWFLIWEKLRMFDPYKMEQALKLSTGSSSVENDMERYHRIGIIKARAANLKPSTFPDNLVVKIVNICRVNALTYRPEFPNLCKHAEVLYKDTSKLNHSCTPNLTYFNSPSFHISWKAARDIAEGEILTICYNEDLLWEPTFVRQAFLKARYNFNCECRRCVDSTELQTHFNSLPCFNCFDPNSAEKHGYLVSVDRNCEADVECNKCGTGYDRFRISACLGRLQKSIQEAEGGTNTLESLCQCVSSMIAEGSLHIHHRLVFKASLNMMAAIRKNMQEKWFRYSEDDLVPYLPFANAVHHIFTTFVPARQEYRGEILTVVTIIRFANMTKSVEAGTTSIQEVDDEFKRCFFREPGEDGKSMFATMLELVDKETLKDSVEFALSRTLHVITARLIIAVRKPYPRLRPTEFIHLKLTEKGLYEQAKQYKLFPISKLGNPNLNN